MGHPPIVASLPLDIIKVRNTLQILGLSPFEILYGYTFLINDYLFYREVDVILKDVKSLAKLPTHSSTANSSAERREKSRISPQRFNTGKVLFLINS